jgi:hypothetical protein
MANEGASQETKVEENTRLSDVAEKLRRIQPGRWRLVSDICFGALFLGLAWWDYDHASKRLIDFNVVCCCCAGCAWIASFFSDFALRFSVKALLYDLVWHGR